MQTALALADAAGAAILPYFRTAGLSMEDKGENGFDPVTIADRAAETAMRDVLARMRPDDAILGEEFGARAGSSGLTWMLDPIDGTRSFLAGTPTWGVLVAASDAQGPRLGVIDQPYTRERFVGGCGQSWMEGPLGRRSLETRAARPLDQAILFTTYPELDTPQETAAFHSLSRAVQLTRYSADCYAYALIALGQVDIVVESGLKPHDIHAPIAVIEAAGGLVTDWQGGSATEGGRVIAAANREIHARVVEIMSRY